MSKPKAAKAAPAPKPAAERQTDLTEVATTVAAREIPLDLIDEDPDLNPRKTFDEAADAELAASVRTRGVQQPILIRPTGERFKVVAGARRYRAAKAAGLVTIPAVERQLDDDGAFEAAAIENLQRDDMNAMDVARAYRRMVDREQARTPDLSLKEAKERVAAIVSKTVRTIELKLQLLDLPEIKQLALAAGKMSAAEATKWLRDRPQLFDLPAEDWLVALEVFDRSIRFPMTNKFEFEGLGTECGPGVNDDGTAKAIRCGPYNLLGFPGTFEDEDRYPNGLFYIRPGWQAQTQLELKFGDVSDEARRLEALAALRAETGGPADLAPGVYATAWLNGPFEPDAATLAEAARQQDEARQRIEDRQRREAEERAARAASEKAGKKRLAAAAKIQERLQGLNYSALDPELAAVISDGGKPLPWFPTPQAGIIAANGERVLHDWAEAPPADTLARVRLIAVVMNTAAGLATPDAPPSPPEQEADEPPIVEDEADAFEDERQDEDDEELEDAAGDGDDPEIPGFLRRLAGGGDSAEANP